MMPGFGCCRPAPAFEPDVLEALTVVGSIPLDRNRVVDTAPQSNEGASGCRLAGPIVATVECEALRQTTNRRHSAF